MSTYYDDNAEAFISSTLTADMSALLNRFAECLPDQGCVLDWGCGSGRDSLWLSNKGFRVTPVDLSPAMCAACERLTGITTRCESFDELREEAVYDGIWASASLLHVPSDELPLVFQKAARALKSGGMMYCSFKYGSFEGMREERFYNDMNEGSLSSIIANTPTLHLADIWITNDARPLHREQRWINCLITCLK